MKTLILVLLFLPALAFGQTRTLEEPVSIVEIGVVNCTTAGTVVLVGPATTVESSGARWIILRNAGAFKVDVCTTTPCVAGAGIELHEEGATGVGDSSLYIQGGNGITLYCDAGTASDVSVMVGR